MSPQRLPSSGSARQPAGGDALAFNAGEIVVKDKLPGKNGGATAEYTSQEATEHKGRAEKITKKQKYYLHEEKKKLSKINGESVYDESRVSLTKEEAGRTVGSMHGARITTYVQNNKAGNLVTAITTIEGAHGDYADFAGGKLTATYAGDAKGNRGPLKTTTWERPKPLTE
jgi:hypothetical protein